MNHGRAFSLVELVIVVIIIAVIAAIAIPRVTGAAIGSREASLVGSLSVMRRAIEAYAAEHGQVFPGAVADGIGGGPESEDSFVSQLTLCIRPPRGKSLSLQMHNTRLDRT